MLYSGARDASAAQKISLQARNGMRNTYIARAIDIMRAHLDAPISQPFIAAQVGLSVRHLERLFLRYLNSSPKKYYMQMRLERARNLLLQTELSVLDIAVACGFENAGHFSKVYRLAFGVSPMMQRGRIN